jgi:hypothetical protein
MPEKSGVSTSILNKINGMFTPDRSHIHHRLLSLGFTHRNSVLVLYIVSIFFAFFAFAITQVETIEKSYTIALLVGFVLFLGVKKLRYREIAILNNGMIMPFFERWIIKRSTFLVLADLCFIALSFILSYTLIRSINSSFLEFVRFDMILLIVLAIQFTVLWTTGLYRETIRQIGIGNALRIISSVAYAVMATTFVLLVIDAIPLTSSFHLLILNFYFLLTCILGLRITWQALSYWFNRDKESGINVLIYGANENGTMILHKINNSPESNYKVLGFLDDDPELEGKFIYGYPIFGSHWQLAKPKFAVRVDTIFLCKQNIKPENFKRLSNLAQKKQIQVKRLDVKLRSINGISARDKSLQPVFMDSAVTNV